VGINVSRPKDIQEGQVFSLVKKTADLLEIQQTIPRDAVVCFDDYVGPGYSLPSAAMV